MASDHETCSTGRSSLPEKDEGLDPITALYCPCVISVALMRKALSVTLWTGCSPLSPFVEPMEKLPAGMDTMAMPESGRKIISSSWFFSGFQDIRLWHREYSRSLPSWFFPAIHSPAEQDIPR